MNNNKILAFSIEINENTFINTTQVNDVKIIKWEPSLRNIIPPNSGFRFIIFWAAHYLGFFKNKSYRSYAFIEHKKAICSLVCVPSFSLWTFMKPNDIQIKNVFTEPNYRGKGFAFKLVKYAISDLSRDKRNIWYLTNEQNTPSIKLCKKAGFKLQGYYQRKKNRWGLFKGVIKRIN